ncbi:MAG TPA: hypothetical protein VF595_17495 [Tepidisphaeraceae bacterium]|jgi:hypothetical protein
MRIGIAALLLSSLVLSGCAEVTVTRPDTNEKGFLTYTPVPHLLVEKNKEGGPVTKLISLPDTSRPMYIEHGGGYGTLDFNFTLENGMLTTFGQKTDSKIPETITGIASLGGLATGVGSLHTALNPVRAAAGANTKMIHSADLKNARIVSATQPNTLRYDIDAIEEAIALLEQARAQLPDAPPAPDTSTVKKMIDKELEDADKKLKKLKPIEISTTADPIEAIKLHLKDLPAIIERLTEAHGLLRAIIDKAAAKDVDTSKQEQAAYILSGAVGRLQGLIPSKSAVELYRIDSNGRGTMYFTRVRLPFEIAPTAD